jgi:hypothetical protein
MGGSSKSAAGSRGQSRGAGDVRKQNVVMLNSLNNSHKLKESLDTT